MSIASEKIGEILSWPPEDRAFLAQKLIVSLDDTVDAGVEKEWHEVIDRRSAEINEGKVECRSAEELIEDMRGKGE
jgi:hypothetical protein